MGADFSGYATKAGLKCSDGRTIMPHAFKAQDGAKVPLVWQHGHHEVTNVLGHAMLENREDGVYAYGYFNDTPSGQNARVLVQSGDIDSMSIYANKLVEKSKQVLHGAIREVSLVLSGANPGAKIDYVAVAHADGEITELEDEAIVYTGLTLEHSDPEDEEKQKEEELEEAAEEHRERTSTDDDLEHAEDKTVKDVYDSLTEEQKNVVHFMIGAALEAATGSAEHSDNDEDALNHQEGNDMTRNVFEQNGGSTKEKATLSHDDVKGIVQDAIKIGSLKEAVEGYALQHGITDIDLLFPDVRNLTNTPEWDKRRTEWVAGVLSGVSKSPFSRIRTMSADITQDEARAKGYIKGTLKKEEFFGLTRRSTTPTTIYKKQKLDRDDIIDITDLDVVAWMKAEMRLMLEEELARAILIGDGRDVDDEDKIRDPAAANDGAGIRSILNEHEMYATTITVNVDDANSDFANETVDAIIRARRFYKGTGTPAFFTTEAVIADFMTSRNAFDQRKYRTLDELASELRVSSIIPVEVMETEPDVIGIMVNLQDYVLGADRGGEVSLFDDFDIDYNQYKYLIETRVSGALKKLKSAIIVRRTAGTNVLAAPVAPAFDAETGELTITDVAGVVYKNQANLTLTNAGSPYEVPAGQTWTVTATPAAGRYFATSEDDQWVYTADA
jgi:HK97 family phage prohead protease